MGILTIVTVLGLVVGATAMPAVAQVPTTFEPRVSLRGQAFSESLHQPRLPDARLAAQQHHVPGAVEGASPARQEEPHLLLAAHQIRQRGEVDGLQTAPHRRARQHAMDRHRGLDALEGTRAEIGAREPVLHEAMRGGADEDGVGFGRGFEAGRKVWSLAEGELFPAGAVTDLSDDDGPGVDPHAHGESQRLHRLHNPEPRAHRSLCVILVGGGIAEVDEESVAQLLGDVAVEAVNHLGAGGLVTSDNVAQFLWIETT